MSRKQKLAFLVVGAVMNSWAMGARIKDITNIRGFRSNPLIGYGLVVGLSGTGDSEASIASHRTATKMLQKLGVEIVSSELVAGSYAAVVVTAKLLPFSRNGDRLDVRLSAMGDASSLAGGTLLLTPLKSVDDKFYVMAQGPVVMGGASGNGSQVLTVGQVIKGGHVEREFLPALGSNGGIILSLKNPDFVTNHRLVKTVNKHFKGFYAKSVNPSSIKVEIPPPFKKDLVAFIAELEVIELSVDHRAVVVINERTGTVVMGNQIAIQPVTVSHGDLAITIEDSGNQNGANKAVVNMGGSTIRDLVDSLNQLGVRPNDLLDILRSMQRAGALHAEIDML